MTGCEGHANLPDDFRVAALAALDKFGPLLDRARADLAQAPAAAQGSTCESCPVCAALAAARGERTDLAVRMADSLAGMLDVLRTALVEGNPAPAQAPADPPPPERPVQRIPVVRTQPDPE